MAYVKQTVRKRTKTKTNGKATKTRTSRPKKTRL